MRFNLTVELTDKEEQESLYIKTSDIANNLVIFQVGTQTVVAQIDAIEKALQELKNFVQLYKEAKEVEINTN